MAQCVQCGTVASEGDKFCRKCGGSVVEDQATEVETVTQPPEAKAVPSPPTDTALRKKAEKRVKERMELLRHFGTYVVVNGFLVVVWALSGAGYPWFLWVMAGWGLGLAIHTITYFVGSKGDSAREQRVQAEMDKIKQERH